MLDYHNPRDVAKIKAVMRSHISSYDNINGCDDINCTKLAEDTANSLDLYVDHENYEIPTEVFDLAVDVADEFIPS